MSERRRSVVWEDPQVAAGAARDLDGRAYLEGLRDGRIPLSPYARLLGFRLVEVADGRVVFETEPGEHLYNTIGLVHGGFAASIVDSAIGSAVTTRMPAGKTAVSIDLQVRFFKPLTVASGIVRCVGTVLNIGRTTAAGEARILDATGRVHAHGTSSLAIVERAER